MNIILRIINAFSLPWLLLRLIRSPRILLYHGITEGNSVFGIENYRKKFIPQEDFLRQIQFLKKNFKIVSLENLVKTLFHSPKQAEGMLAVTFDDGYQNVYRVAWPILKKYNIPFTVFLTTDFIEKQKPLWVDRLEYAIGRNKKDKLKLRGKGFDFDLPLDSPEEKMNADSKIRTFGKLIPESEKQILINQVVKECEADLTNHISEEPNYRPLNWNEISEMVNSGLATMASHTKNHAIAIRVPSEEFEKDVLESKSIIEDRLRMKCSIFAYPNGKKEDFSEKTTEILKKQGFKIALTTEMEFLSNKSNPLMLSRLTMDETQDQKMFLVTISGIRSFLRKIRSFIMKVEPNY